MNESGSIRICETSTISGWPTFALYLSKIATYKKVVNTSLHIQWDRFLSVTMTSASWRKSRWIVGGFIRPQLTFVAHVTRPTYTMHAHAFTSARVNSCSQNFGHPPERIFKILYSLQASVRYFFLHSLQRRPSFVIIYCCIT